MAAVVAIERVKMESEPSLEEQVMDFLMEVDETGKFVPVPRPVMAVLERFIDNALSGETNFIKDIFDAAPDLSSSVRDTPRGYRASVLTTDIRTRAQKRLAEEARVLREQAAAMFRARTPAHHGPMRKGKTERKLANGHDPAAKKRERSARDRARYLAIHSGGKSHKSGK